MAADTLLNSLVARPPDRPRKREAVRPRSTGFMRSTRHNNWHPAEFRDAMRQLAAR